MSEMAKTVLFVAAAAASLLLAFAMGPSSESFNVDELVGLRLNQFEVDVAKRLKIVKFDKETAATREFEVAETDGLWTIPSKQGYPADAARQMAEAATCLIDREVLRVAGTSANDHESLGVIDPSTSKLDSKAEGVGTRVTITDSNDEKLADMLIGKPVKDAEGQYHVGNADQDVVYVVNLEPEKLSTKFEDWIEDDLLKLNPMDIRRVNIKDYSAELQPVLTAGGISMQVSWDRRGEMTLEYNQEDSAWEAAELKKLDLEAKELVPYELAEDEELNEESLRELRNGLDDLLLVDVERKPAGLSADLKAGGDFLKDQDAATSLMRRGFAPLSLEEGGPLEILSSEGEIICTLEDGVEYVLRFGNLQLDSDGEAEEEAAAAEEAANADAGVNRYLFVMARLNESMLEQPELEELPELPADSETDEVDATETEPVNESSEVPESEASEEAAANEEGPVEEEEEEQEEEGGEADTEETDTEEAVAAEGEAAADEAEQDDPLAELIAAREEIEKENQRRLNEYQDKIKAAQERVTELNERFGDWYYVISNDVYKKIHLSRDQVISKKKAEGEAGGAEQPATGGGIPGLPNLPIGGGAGS